MAELVVREPETFGDLFSKGNVVVPCQCYYNTRDNILTEIMLHSHEKLKKIPTNSASFCKKIKKDAQTETPSQHCCVCEYFRSLEERKNKIDLWNKQFTRWWGWNWPRKRKEFLSKFKIKSDKSCTCSASCKDETDNLNKCHLHSSFQNQEKNPALLNSVSFNSHQKRNVPKYISDLTEPLHPVPPITTCGFKKPYKSKRKKKKYEKRLYEGWVREITSSDSDNSIKNVKIKMKTPNTPQNNEDYMHYLSLRLRNLNSDESLDNDKKINGRKKVPTSVEPKYVSPISGCLYNLNLPEVSVPFSENYETEYLNPLNIKDGNFLSAPEFEWMKHYNLMKEEHSDLLKSICDVLCTKNVNKEQSETEIRNIDYTDSKFKTNPFNKIGSTIQESSPYEVVKLDDFDNLKKPNLFSEHKSEIISKNPFYDCSPVKSLMNKNEYCSKDINLPILRPTQPLLISNSSTLFYQDAIDSHPTELNNVQDDLKIVRNVEENIFESSYDINYISNNLQSFTSTISDTELLITPKIDKLNVTEDMSEEVLQELLYQ